MRNEQPKLDEFVFFLDRTHGKRVLPAMLRRVGFVVEAHDDHFGREEEDPLWIAECGRRDWIILSGDKRLEKNVENRQAVIEAKCKVFIFSDTSSFPEEWASAVIMARDKIQRVVRKNDGPFYVRVGKLAESHIGEVRFVGIGGPKRTVDEKPATLPTAITSEEVTPEPRNLFEQPESTNGAARAEEGNELQADPAHPAPVQGADGGSAQSKTTPEENPGKK